MGTGNSNIYGSYGDYERSILRDYYRRTGYNNGNNLITF